MARLVEASLFMLQLSCLSRQGCQKDQLLTSSSLFSKGKGKGKAYASGRHLKRIFTSFLKRNSFFKVCSLLAWYSATAPQWVSQMSDSGSENGPSIELWTLFRRCPYSSLLNIEANLKPSG
eukprot:1161583-Pelagomonas_calceolata.AAC.13